MAKEMGEDLSEIQEFFKGRSVFITGAGGYLGGVLLEHLLRLCPGLAEIFILLREKKGLAPEKRKDIILSKPIFWKVKEDNPKAIEKIYVVSGELTVDGLGISLADLEKIKANVSVVFNCAASISFRQTFRFMVMNNVIGTYNVIKFCKELPKIVALVHTSTAYSNCYQKVIEEEVAQTPVPVQRITEAARDGDEEFLRVQGKKWPNAYTFTKSVAENVVADEAADIPRAIVRPSIISGVWKGSLPGYMETGTTFADLCYGVALGFLQVVHIDKTKIIDTIPPDIVANTLLASAWSVATKRTYKPLVINCISSNTQILRTSEVIKDFMDNYYYCLSPYALRSPNVSFVANTTMFRLLSFLYHHVPGYVVDFYLRQRGFKARCVKGYKWFDQSMLDARFFALHEFSFKSENFEGLRSALSKRDNEIFCIDFSGFSISSLVKHASVNKLCRFKEDDMLLKYKQLEFAIRTLMYTQLYKCFLLFLLVLLAWYFVKLLFSILM